MSHLAHNWHESLLNGNEFLSKYLRYDGLLSDRKTHIFRFKDSVPQYLRVALKTRIESTIVESYAKEGFDVYSFEELSRYSISSTLSVFIEGYEALICPQD